MDPFDIPSYDQCEELVKSSDCFYQKTEMVNDVPITSFSYRIASYGDFSKPGARNMRGLTFRADTKELVAAPFWKFFNYGENPFTDPKLVDGWEPVSIQDKLDGSLVYFYFADDSVCCKTKYDCYAPQAQRARGMVLANDMWYEAIIESLNNRMTPMFEYVGPDNQIVLPYDYEDLIFIGMRDWDTGKLLEKVPREFMVFTQPKKFNIRVSEVIDHCNSSVGKLVEGYVVRYGNGDLVKFKTLKYRDIHHVLSECQTSDKYIANLTLNEQLDDVLTLIPESHKQRVLDLAETVRTTYLHKVHAGTQFYEKYHKELDQKSYALKAMGELGRGTDEFSITMGLYTNSWNEAKFKEGFVSKYRWKSNPPYSLI